MLTKITKRVVDAASPKERDSFVWDSEAKGFGLKVTPKGRKVYVVQYRMLGQSTKRYTIGKHGSPWTPDGARTEALRILGMVANEQDPSAEKKAKKLDITVSELCDLYVSEGARTKKASTLAVDRSRIERHVKPLLGKNRVKALRKSDIEKFMRDVADGKTSLDEKTGFRGRSIVTGGQGAANRTLGMLGSIFQYAVDENLRVDNPVRGVKKYKEGRPARFLALEEITRLGAAIKAAEENGVNPYALYAIRLLLLTGCRKNEILSLKWSEVDIEGGFLRLSDSKTGAKPVHLASPAKALLADIPRIANNPYVIVGDKDGMHLIGLQKIWSEIRASANLEDVRLHDLRHSFASVGAASGLSLPMIGALLGHSQPSTTARYAHLAADPIQSAAEGISERMSIALRGKK